MEKQFISNGTLKVKPLEAGIKSLMQEAHLKKYQMRNGYHYLHLEALTTRIKLKKAYTKSGDLFLLDISSGKKTQITNTINAEYNVNFSGDEKHIIYQSDNNVFAWNITDGTTQQLTNFQSGSGKKEKQQADYEEWLNDDQLAYFQILKERKMVSELRKETREAQSPKRPQAIYLKGQSLSNVSLSPDMRFVTYRLTKRTQAKRTKVPAFCLLSLVI